MTNELLYTIEEARYQVQISLPEIMAPELLRRLRQAQQRGVQIQWVMENPQDAATSMQVIVQDIAQKGADCWSTKQLSEYFIIIDQQLVWQSPVPFGNTASQNDPLMALTCVQHWPLVQAFQYRWLALVAEAVYSFGERLSLSLMSDKPILKAGDHTRLYWEAPIGSEVMIRPHLGSVPQRGQQQLQIEGDTHFVMEVRHEGKHYQRHSFVRCVPDPSILFTVNKTQAKPGEGIRLWWQCHHSDYQQIGGLGAVETTDKHRFQFETDTDFTLTATGPRTRRQQHIHISRK